MAPTTDAKARYSRELAQHTRQQFTAARETLENQTSETAKLPAAQADPDCCTSRPHKRPPPSLERPATT
ncbi:hypothetical protein DFH06DRAFT_1328942 [Mycena polygramma]|nr:hypothetical protein DFH06DRAFT_1328942 [Mycena polygramma]